MASANDYSFLSASANIGFANSSGQYDAPPNGFSSSQLSAPLKAHQQHNSQRIGRAVPSYSTQISGNSVPSYSTQAFYNHQNNNTSHHINASVSSRPNAARNVVRRQSMPMNTTNYASAIATNLASAAHRRNATNNSAQLLSARPHNVSSGISVAPSFDENQVPLNKDPNPVVIRKKPTQQIHYTQNVSVKFLQPPPPQQPGDIVITQQKDVQAAPVAPRVIRHQPPPPNKPAPLVVRERPPPAPAPIPPEHHVIPGKVLPPPPRKVITERLPQLPTPPQDIIVERWLEYGPRTRRVVFHPAPKLIPLPAPRNVVIQWDSPSVALNRQMRNLGVSISHPNQYVARYGPSLVDPSAIPQIARALRPENGLVLAENSRPQPVRLVGDVQALKLINRNRGGVIASRLNAPAPVPAAAVSQTHHSVVSVSAMASEPTVTLIAEETASFENASNIFGAADSTTFAINNSNAFYHQSNAFGSNVYNSGLATSHSAVALSDGLAAGSGLINASGSAYYDF